MTVKRVHLILAGQYVPGKDNKVGRYDYSLYTDQGHMVAGVDLEGVWFDSEWAENELE